MDDQIRFTPWGGGDRSSHSSVIAGSSCTVGRGAFEHVSVHRWVHRDSRQLRYALHATYPFEDFGLAEFQVTAESNVPFDSAICADLFAAEVRVAASPLRDCVDELTTSERELIQGVVHKRELEFATGRSLAKQVLTELDHRDFELLRDQDRVPIWPSNVVGSISHTTGQAEGLCIVAVASGLDRIGLGVDVEPDLPVQEGLQDTICRPSEREWVRAAGTAESGRRCRVVFSVKEAVYKAFYPRIREFWAFKDVEVCVDLAHGSFRAQLPESADRSEVEGGIIRRDGWIISGADYA